MNIYTVRDNLKNTIAGKEKMLADQWDKMAFGDPSWQGDIVKQMAIQATIEFLKLNIDELRKILADVELCCEKATQDSWALNPDRSGGQFTEDEIYNHNRTDWIEP
jgi:hypothetical protein